MSLKKLGCLLIFAAARSLESRRPDAAGAAGQPDSPEVIALIEKAKKAGGAMWADALTSSAKRHAPTARTIRSSRRRRCSTNVWVLGNAGTVVYIFQTSAGLLTIDSLGAAQVDTLLLTGFRSSALIRPR